LSTIETGTDPKRRYAFRDVLARTYAGLIHSAGTEELRDQLRVEYEALNRFYSVYVTSGLIGSISAVDPGRLHSSSPFNRTHLAKSERQVDARDDYRQAKARLVGLPWTVVDMVVLNGETLERAGYAIGATSERRRASTSSTNTSPFAGFLYERTSLNELF
jgi:hypothetical protein